jgi:hypothetical protein
VEKDGRYSFCTLEFKTDTFTIENAKVYLLIQQHYLNGSASKINVFQEIENALKLHK